MRRLLLGSGLLLLSAAALANDCDNAGTQAEMNQCAANQLQAADGKLNQVYNSAMARAPLATKALLKNAQLQWIALRDADCELIASGTEGGTLQPTVRSQCLMDKTVERTAWLESLLTCEEGDVSCPLPPAH